MQSIQCAKCDTPISFLSVFIAGLPSKIVCGSCKSNVRLRFNPFVFYPIAVVLIVFTLVAGLFVGILLEDAIALSFLDGKLRLVTIVAFIILLEACNSLWILYFFRVVPEQKIDANVTNQTSTIKVVSAIPPEVDASPVSDNERIQAKYRDACNTISNDLNKPELVACFDRLANMAKNIGASNLYDVVEKEQGVDFAQYFVEIEGDDENISFILFSAALEDPYAYANLDWKLTVDPVEMLFALNNVYKAQHIEEISDSEKSDIEHEISKLEKNSEEVANAIKIHMHNITKRREKCLLWLDTYSDDVTFFVVSQACYNKLINTELEPNVRFYE